MLKHEYVVTLVIFLFVCQTAVTLYRYWHFRHLKRKTFPAVVGFSAIVTSTVFTAVAGTLVFFTKNGSGSACEVAILTCIFLYTATKAQIYVFFIERMHIVHKTPHQTRLSSKLYIFNFCLLLPYVGVMILMIIYRISHVEEDGICHIGLRQESSLPLLAYDSFFSLYSIAVFVWPLFHSKALAGSERLLWVAKKNIYGSVMSTISSFLNIYWLYHQETHTADGCLMFCTIDVMVNVLVMNYLISGGKSNKNQDESSNTPSRVASLSVQTKVYPSTFREAALNDVTDSSRTTATVRPYTTRDIVIDTSLRYIVPDNSTTPTTVTMTAPLNCMTEEEAGNWRDSEA